LRSIAETERWPARPHSSRDAGSGVVLRHRAAAAACLTVCCVSGKPHAGARSPDGFLHNHCPNSRVSFNKRFIFFKHGFLQLWTAIFIFSHKTIFLLLIPVYYHLFLQFMSRLEETHIIHCNSRATCWTTRSSNNVGPCHRGNNI